MNQRERSVSMYSEYRTATIATKFEIGVQPDETTFSPNTIVNGGGSGGGGGNGGGGNGGGSK